MFRAASDATSPGCRGRLPVAAVFNRLRRLYVHLCTPGAVSPQEQSPAHQQSTLEPLHLRGSMSLLPEGTAFPGAIFDIASLVRDGLRPLTVAVTVASATSVWSGSGTPDLDGDSAVGDRPSRRQIPRPIGWRLVDNVRRSGRPVVIDAVAGAVVALSDTRHTGIDLAAIGRELAVRLARPTPQGARSIVLVGLAIAIRSRPSHASVRLLVPVWRSDGVAVNATGLPTESQCKSTCNASRLKVLIISSQSVVDAIYLRRTLAPLVLYAPAAGGVTGLALRAFIRICRPR